MFKVAPFVILGVDKHVQYDRRPAKIADVLICDGIINRAGCDVAAANQRAA